MKKEYFALKAPVTKINIYHRGPHILIDLFIGHQLSGTITIDPEDQKKVIDLFKSNTGILYTLDGGASYHRYGVCGDDCDCTELPQSDLQIISDSGELTTVGTLLKNI